MAKEPDERYSTATEVRRDLAPIMVRIKAVEQGTPVAVEKQALGVETSTAQQVLLDRIRCVVRQAEFVTRIAQSIKRPPHRQVKTPSSRIDRLPPEVSFTTVAREMLSLVRHHITGCRARACVSCNVFTRI